MKDNFFSLITDAIELIAMAANVIVALAVLGFLWGIVRMLFSSDNEVAKKEGRSFMLYGVITLFVMTSIWGLVYILRQTFGIETEYQGDINYEEDSIFDIGEQRMI